MVPGLQVNRVNSNTWAITCRGFQDQFANKLLVMIDGRNVYSSNYSGVYWDMQNVLLEDVERIEVIRGPGGSLWGANAVNGIINIITKSAQDTQGLLLRGGGGNEEQGMGAVRYGGKLSENALYRIYSQYFNLDDSATPSGEDFDDNWDMVESGFRLDWDKTEQDQIRLQGDIFYGDINKSGTYMASPYSLQGPVSHLSGGNIVGRWNHTFSDTSDATVQIYYDHFGRFNPTIRHTDDNFDLDIQHRFLLGQRQEITWGFGYRYNNNLFASDREDQFVPNRRQTNLYSSFLQDKITLTEDKLYLTLGSKFEHNHYNGFEMQPSARLVWTPDRNNTVWAAVSRPLRTSSRRESDTYYDNGRHGPPPGGMRVITQANKDWKSEEVHSYELGYRLQATKNLFFDVTGFFSRYDNLLTHEESMSFSMDPEPSMILEINMDNKMDGEVYGAEVSANWHLTDSWQLAAGYTFLQMQLHPDNSSTSSGVMDEILEDYSPHNQFHLRSYLDLPHNLELDMGAYYSDNLPGMGIPGYIRTDVRLGWHINENMELSAVVQNLFDRQHPEFSNFLLDTGEIERSFFVKLTYRF
jgi:iron complex outermembrane receptor protein